MSEQILQNAWRLHQAGNLNEAARLYQEVLRTNPRNFNALQLLGFVHFQRGEFSDAERIMEKAIRINPSSVDALYNRGCALQALDRPKEALQCFGKALSVKPDFVPAHVNRGNVLSQMRRYDEALVSYDKALSLQPDAAEALLNRGNVLLELKRPADALSSYDKALAREPRDPTAWNNRGSALEELSRHTEAVESFGKAIALAADYPDAYENRGNALMTLERAAEALGDFDRALALEPANPRALYGRAGALKTLKRPDEALTAYDRALALDPAFAEALIGRANALLDLKRHAEALSSLDAVLARDPKNVDALSNRANVLIRMKRHEEALADSEKALAADPAYASAWHNRGSALSGLKRYRESVASFERALSLDQKTAATWNNRGNALIALKRYADALPDFERALALDPVYVDALSNKSNALSNLKDFGQAIAAANAALALDPDHAPTMSVLIHSGLHACDWRALDRVRMRAFAGLTRGQRTIQPFDCKALTTAEEDNLQSARLWVAEECPASPQPLWRGERYQHERIRVAYVSTDLRAHAVGFLVVGAIEQHDKSRFEVIGVSLGIDDKSETRARFEAAFDRFIDVREKSDSEVAALLREMEIDVVVDLNGFTGEPPRTRIFAQRPAPVQVNYLGYPGTMGADYIDYIIADPIVITPVDEPYYSEKIAYLPDTYQANDSRRPTAREATRRSEAGLPDQGFVFASFNNTYKISSEMFSVWTRLLTGVEGSVLWLLEDNPFAAENLRREAAARGVNPDRLIFAPRTTPDKHLARQKLADLFLDTLPYNAHTTASDALWIGLPVITTPGTTFPARVAASLLTAIGLPELITPSLDEYERLALKLARDAEALALLKSKLSVHRETFPLFDTKRFTRHLEAALATMWERHQQGLPPQTFSVVRQ
jgi:predicted O-linked N-acetylglucosamine transferase (SPINDLY family)